MIYGENSDINGDNLYDKIKMFLMLSAIRIIIYAAPLKYLNMVLKFEAYFCFCFLFFWWLIFESKLWFKDFIDNSGFFLGKLLSAETNLKKSKNYIVTKERGSNTTLLSISSVQFSHSVVSNSL